MMMTYRNFEAPDPHPQVTVITNNDNQNIWSRDYVAT